MLWCRLQAVAAWSVLTTCNGRRMVKSSWRKALLVSSIFGLPHNCTGCASGIAYFCILRIDERLHEFTPVVLMFGSTESELRCHSFARSFGSTIYLRLLRCCRKVFDIGDITQCGKEFDQNSCAVACEGLRGIAVWYAPMVKDSIRDMRLNCFSGRANPSRFSVAIDNNWDEMVFTSRLRMRAKNFRGDKIGRSWRGSPVKWVLPSIGILIIIAIVAQMYCTVDVARNVRSREFASRRVIHSLMPTKLCPLRTMLQNYHVLSKRCQDYYMYCAIDCQSSAKLPVTVDVVFSVALPYLQYHCTKLCILCLFTF